jgi:hypothetical protein
MNGKYKLKPFPLKSGLRHSYSTYYCSSYPEQKGRKKKYKGIKQGRKKSNCLNL